MRVREKEHFMKFKHLFLKVVHLLSLGLLHPLRQDHRCALHFVLYPQTFFFQFVTVNRKAEVVPHEDAWHLDEPPPFDLDINNELDLPIYSSRDIKVLEHSGEGIFKVLGEGKEM